MSETCSLCPEPATGRHYDQVWCDEPRCVKHMNVERDDQLRLSFVQELWALHAELGNAHMDQTLYEYERRTKGRIGQ